jgi:hypothetical protein
MPHPRWKYSARKEPKFAELREEVWCMIKGTYGKFEDDQCEVLES